MSSKWWIILAILALLGLGIALLFMSRAESESVLQAERHQAITADQARQLHAEIERLEAERAQLEADRKKLEELRRRREPSAIK